MSLSPAAILSPATRSLEWLARPGALLSSTALATGQLASLGPIASIIEGAVDPDPTPHTATSGLRLLGL